MELEEETNKQEQDRTKKKKVIIPTLVPENEKQQGTEKRLNKKK